MKLIRCYIEHFGGLSQYRLDFSPGLTTVQAPNGFGKTTLAEFIRAMFYGFPRSGRSLDKNPRKKYLPWQGGKYGGYLVFEFQGTRYRIERTFGATPRGDHFTLYNADTNQRSDRFSEQIGVELFQLDSDSFERSTYLPQIHDGGPLSTDLIQAKLGDLVEDTNDVNNYDKAIKSLQSRRSALVSFRGGGGSVAAAQERISQLQSDLGEASAQRSQLEEVESAAAALETRRSAAEAELDRLREAITQASESAARATLSRQYQDLIQEQTSLSDQLAALQGRYPSGMPAPEELDALVPVFDRAAALQDAPLPSVSDQDAWALLDREASRFAGGIPEEASLEGCQQDCQRYLLTAAALESARLSPAEADQLQDLEAFFAPGLPEEDTLRQAETDKRRLSDLSQRRLACRLPEEEYAQLRTLEDFFAAGVPSEAELDEKQNLLSQIEHLKYHSAEAPPPQKAPSKRSAFLPLLLLGLVAAAAGIVLLTQQRYPLGGGLLGVGGLFLLGAMYLRLKQTLSRELSGDRRGQADTTAAQLSQLEGTLSAFLDRYLPAGTVPAEGLALLRERQQAHRRLTEQAQALTREEAALSQEEAVLRQQLSLLFAPYFPEGVPQDALTPFQLNLEQFQRLRQRQAEVAAQQQALSEEQQTLEETISSFLSPFCGAVSPADFSAAAAALRRDCAAYHQAQQRCQERAVREAERQAALADCAAQVSHFSAAYSLSLALQDREGLQALRDDLRRAQEGRQQLTALSAKLEAFREKHPESVQIDAAPAAEDLSALKSEERQRSADLASLSQELLEHQQLIRLLRSRVEQIPAQEDELEALIRRRDEDKARCEILDQTIAFLGTAKEQLSHHYLGTVQSRFAAYLQRMTAESSEQLFVDSRLEVQLERAGAARELSYFSAGQSDMILLCMRFALVDALFQDTDPLIILDDPFVNLDDAHTEKALALLEELAQDHQILYLVCNSSRSLET